MTVLSPIWLLAAIPLVGLAVWLMWGRRPRVHVPFLALWQGPVAARRARKPLDLPPVFIVLALLAMALAVLAAARIQVGSATHAQVRLIVDRGLTMSAKGARDLRFREAAAEFATAIDHTYKSASVDLITVPGSEPQRLPLQQLPSAIAKLKPSSIDTRTMLRQTLDRESAPVWVVSDAKLSGVGSKIMQVAPSGSVQDVGIVSLSARQAPLPEVMVRVRNESPRRAADLIVASDGREVRRNVQLATSGGEANVFVELPKLADVISARLDVQDDLPADDQAWLVREASWPRIEAHSPVPPEVQRMIEVYGQRRRSSPDASRVLLVGGIDQLPAQTPGVILTSPGAIESSAPAAAAPHPVTAHVNWTRLPGPIRLAGAPPEGWTPLVWSGQQVLVAARPTSPTQVWIGFDAPRWAATSDFVIFWTNVFDWTGGGGESFVSHPMSQWSPEWLAAAGPADSPAPGLYRRADGTWHAFNAAAIPFDHAPAFPWRSHLRDLAMGRGRIDLTAWLAAAALLCLLFSVVLWAAPRRAWSPSGDDTASLPNKKRPVLAVTPVPQQAARPIGRRPTA